MRKDVSTTRKKVKKFQWRWLNYAAPTAQKMKFSFRDFQAKYG